ncbi:type IV pilin N-terminal domain-containing protein [uncultured Methanospirillum sp.]|uniref:type IV pilin N-terminal domain-containing protein n=1 Tax=uncultured Methanospirillum sp. TaxID=262503 RepID=UPI0029C94399|nr:type IV pilin N-terminal domain-containing protein [uncultured Methanospirillum sp.]
MNNTNPSFDSAVSPVVGVLLMLVVTIIIAAVVSSFAGGLTTGQQAAPSLSADIRITNSGTWIESSGFYFTVTGVDKPIPTKDLKMTTKWTAQDGTRGEVTILPWNGTMANCNYQTSGSGSTSISARHAPIAGGTGINTTKQAAVTENGINYASAATGTFFGNYSLMSGVVMKNSADSLYGNTAYGSQPFEYAASSPYSVYEGVLANGVMEADGCQSILGHLWYHLRAGDVVTVTVFHIPSGKIILKKDVIVEA